jgi:hypothetical protein
VEGLQSIEFKSCVEGVWSWLGLSSHSGAIVQLAHLMKAINPNETVATSPVWAHTYSLCLKPFGLFYLKAGVNFG